MRRLFVAVALLLVSSFAVAQNIGPLPPLTAHVDVNVVNVDVNVTDTDGRPVRGLTKADFEIYEDGKLQPITNFSVFENLITKSIPGAVAAAPPADAPKAGTGRKILLLVDNNFMEKPERNRALNTIERYLDSSFNGEWAVASIEHTSTIIQPFTTDRALLHVAFDKVRDLPSHYMNHMVDRAILSDRSKKDMEFATPYDFESSIRFAGREQTYRSLLTMQNTARAVVETARAYAADEGKKFIILLTGGIESSTTFSAYSGNKPDPELEQVKLDIAKMIDEMVREANGANFTVHVVNARAKGMPAQQHDVQNSSSGIKAHGGNLLKGKWGDEPIDVADVDSAPLSIALGTGGMYLPSGDVHESIARIEQQTSNFYSLGYSPEHMGDRAYHNIKVRVKRNGVRVSNRVGYYDLSSDDRLEDMLRARMTYDRPVGTLPVKIRVGNPKTFETSSLVVPVQANMPMQSVTMLPRDDGYVGRVHVYISVFDNRGRNVGFHHQTQEVSVTPAQMNDLATSAFNYTMNVHLKKGGQFTVVITLRDELSNEMGSAIEPVSL